MLTIEIAGVAAPKGSMRARVLPTGLPTMYHDNKKTKPWMAKVKAATVRAMSVAGIAEPYDGAVEIEYYFFLPRPKSTSREWPSVKPDLDKLVRCIDDALEGSLLSNDSRIVRIVAAKLYGEHPHTKVIVRAYP